jgi:hypothetical protein
MHDPWITSSIRLPCEGQRVEFVLDGRDVAMEGAYLQQIFRTRWTGYDPERVHTWRSADTNTHMSLRAMAGHPLLSLVAMHHNHAGCEKLASNGEPHVVETAHADLPVGQTSSVAVGAGSCDHHASAAAVAA